MKIRNGFVSNSSSSSFVVAKRKDCSRQDIEDLLEKNKKSIEQFISEAIEYSEVQDEFAEIEDDDAKYDLAKEMLTKEFFNLFNSHSMKLDDWLVVSLEAGSEDGYFFDNFLYSYMGSANTEKFKISSFS